MEKISILIFLASLVQIFLLIPNMLSKNSYDVVIDHKNDFSMYELFRSEREKNISHIVFSDIVKHEHNRRYKLILEIDFSKGFAPSLSSIAWFIRNFVYLSSQSAWRKKMIGRVGENETGTPLPKSISKMSL